jgi:protein-S-isoprenylcysteine O-methyltransferase Ste14
MRGQGATAARRRARCVLFLCWRLATAINDQPKRTSSGGRYAAANVRVEEGQKVISTGVYGYIRHPMYFAALFLFIGTPLALGSWWTLLLFPVFIPVLVARILNEEKVLVRDLAGYVEYTHNIRYRLIPSVW